MKMVIIVRLLLAGLLTSIVTPDVIAGDESKDAQSAADYIDVGLPKGMRRYVIPMEGCAIEFIAQDGGYAQAYMGGGGPYGYFSHNSYVFNSEKKGALVLGLSCHRGNAKEICFRLLPSEEAENRWYYNIRRLENVHPIYSGVTQISSFALNSSRPGQVRKLDFCLGDNSRALITEGGGVEIGHDSRDVSKTPGKELRPAAELALPDVLNLIRSIRFMSADGGG
ncbi:hypothetical protein [Burkholderia sp. BCC1999]|uniref:hypothetical protein n=1 Tax=Burkholderia sp. BCC1999 TaxID=2817448 RepID=UPI002AC34884|nr:hypothetical protein [Burkholderia sp. BCC1999]